MKYIAALLITLGIAIFALGLARLVGDNGTLSQSGARFAIGEVLSGGLGVLIGFLVFLRKG